MESKTTLCVIPESNKRMSSTSQLFKRIDKIPINREPSSGKQSRLLPRTNKNYSISASKQNKSFESYLHKVKSALKVDETETTSNYLNSLRKEFDRMNKDIRQQMSSINIKRNETSFMKDKISKEIQQSSSAKDKFEALSSQLEIVQVQQQQAKMSKKTLEHIITRMRQDELKQKNDCRIKQSILHKKQTLLKMKEDQFLFCEDNTQKLIEQISKLEDQFMKEDKQRELKYKDYQSCMVDLEQKEVCERDRKERTFELLSIETNDIMDAKNIVLRDVLMTNKVLDKLLECKISELLKHYQILQNSYHLIKTETNISDPLSLTKKFFSYDEALEQLTAKIDYYEQKQQECIAKNKHLKQIEKQKIIKKLQEDKICFSNLDNFQDEKEKLIQESLESQLQCKKIKAWINNILESLNLAVHSTQDCSTKMFNITSTLINQSEQIKNGIIPVCQFMSAGVRLKKVLKDICGQDQKKRKSEMQEMNDTNISQNDYIMLERKKIKRNEFVIKTQPNKSMRIND